MDAENFGVDWSRVELPFPCEIHQMGLRALPQAERFKVLFLSGEPAPLRLPVDKVRYLAPHFDLVVSSDRSLMDLPNAAFFIYGDPWVNTVPPRKDFSLSFLYSPGNQAWDGYLLRDAVWPERHRIGVPKQFWYTRKNVPGAYKVAPEERAPVYSHADKAPLFESMFALAIENVREADYFSEKILDAFQTFTVPLYYGCPNIGDYFDLDGIILVQDRDELLAHANALTPQRYWDCMPAMVENKRRAQTYQGGLRRLGRLIEDFARQRGLVF